MARESKKFALFSCCLMTMQALRLVISTAGFCVVRFHIDPSLFGIFISRLVNAVMMSSLLGNWLGDLIVFGAGGQLKLIAVALANWAELICFCSGLFCICHTEAGHLTGFYWSMVCAYFWWKVGEAPSNSVGVPDVDWYYAGFTLSGVWAAMLKGIVMMLVEENHGIYSDVLGEVNVSVVGDVSVVGARSVKTTVDYRAAKWLFVVVIVVTFFMCVQWDVISTAVNTHVSDWVRKQLSQAVLLPTASNNKLAKAIQKETGVKVSVSQTVTLTNATVAASDISAASGEGTKITIVVRNVASSETGVTSGGTLDQKLKSVVDASLQGKISTVSGKVEPDEQNPSKKKLTLTVTTQSTKQDRDNVLKALKAAATQAAADNNRVAAAIQALGSGKTVDVDENEEATLNFSKATVDKGDVKAPGTGNENKIVITVKGVTKSKGTDGTIKKSTAWGTADVEKEIKGQLDGLLGAGKITSVGLDGSVKGAGAPFPLKIKVTVNSSTDRDSVLAALRDAALRASAGDNKLATAIRTLGSNKKVNLQDGSGETKEAQLTFGTATVRHVRSVGDGAEEENGTVIPVGGVTGGPGSGAIQLGQETQKTANLVKEKLEGLLGMFGTGTIAKVTLLGSVSGSTVTGFKITVTETAAGRIVNLAEVKAVAIATGLVVAAIFAVPGAALFAWISGRTKWCAAVGGALALVVMRAVYDIVIADVKEGEEWVQKDKWATPEQDETTWAPMMGLGVGIGTGALMGLCIGCCTASEKRGTAAGALVGAFAGLWSGEIVNGYKTVEESKTTTGNEWKNFMGKKNKPWVVACGMLIVVAGLGTVYSIYPGMAPCSITQFQYFNIIDIWILILSVIGPIVIMVVDLAELDWKLGNTILNADGDGDFESGSGKLMWGAVGSALLMTFATLVCEIIVICVLQYPHSKLAKDVTNSPWRACTLTILMVSFQLTSTGIGFACVAAGAGFNTGIMNANSTIILWSIECTAVLGEGYLTELKKYEPGKWPTQGMGVCKSFWWWLGRVFGNAWQIWCCIGTTDLRRDIMLCRQ